VKNRRLKIGDLVSVIPSTLPRRCPRILSPEEIEQQRHDDVVAGRWCDSAGEMIMYSSYVIDASVYRRVLLVVAIGSAVTLLDPQSGRKYYVNRKCLEVL